MILRELSEYNAIGSNYTVQILINHACRSNIALSINAIIINFVFNVLENY
jgi:hypothetical protein